MLSEPGRRILLHHGLDKKGAVNLNDRFLSAGRFEAQIRFSSQHVQIVSLDNCFWKSLTNSGLRERLTTNPYISQANRWVAAKKGQY